MLQFLSIVRYISAVSIICQIVIASPLNKVNDDNLPINHVFYSSEFEDTDMICTHLYRNWIKAQGNAGQQTFYGDPLPLVVSSNIKLMGFGRIGFLCRDFRTFNSINNAIFNKDEVAVIGPYQLHCNTESELARKRPKPPNTRYDKRTRCPGYCMKVSSKDAEKSSVAVAAGTSNCLDMTSGSHSNIEAYLMDDTAGYDGDVSKQDYAAWLSIIETGSLRHESVVNQNFVTMSSDPTRPRIYRACAKMQPGHGNGRLYLFSTLQS